MRPRDNISRNSPFLANAAVALATTFRFLTILDADGMKPMTFNAEFERTCRRKLYCPRAENTSAGEVAFVRREMIVSLNP